jgi:hypothetical protein
VLTLDPSGVPSAQYPFHGKRHRKEIVLVGETSCEAHALLFGLRILIQEAKGQRMTMKRPQHDTSGFAFPTQSSFSSLSSSSSLAKVFDVRGILRRHGPHVKGIVRDAMAAYSHEKE